jgi:hypothetical protein
MHGAGGLEASEPMHEEDARMPRLTRHPAEVELLALELGRNETGSSAAARHVAGCRVCTRRPCTVLSKIPAATYGSMALPGSARPRPSICRGRRRGTDGARSAAARSARTCVRGPSPSGQGREHSGASI